MEELYDTQVDPHQLHNLADDSQHADTLTRMRAELAAGNSPLATLAFSRSHKCGPGFRAEKTPWDIARELTRYPLDRLLNAADAVGRDDDAARAQRQWLRDTDDGVRYWAAVGFLARKQLSEADRDALLSAIRDDSPVVRIEAAAALARHGDAEAALPVLMAALADASPEVVLHASRALELLGPVARPARQKMSQALAIAREREAAGQDIAMFIRFSLESALSQ